MHSQEMTTRPRTTTVAKPANDTPLQIRVPKAAARAIMIAAAEANQSISEFLLACFEATVTAPLGDVRLTANISADHHLRLKIRAAQERTTVGEMIEAWIDSW